MLKTSGIIWHLQEGGLDGAVPPLTPCQGLWDRGWEKNQGWKQPPKTSFPCDLNDNCSCPASWLDWETSFSPCYPIIQMTHVYLKWSLLYISCQPRYTFNSKEGINWQRCKKDVFAVPVSVKVSLRRKNYASLDTNVSGQCPLLLAKLCFQAATIFTFAVQFLSVCWSFILHSLPKKPPQDCDL